MKPLPLVCALGALIVAAGIGGGAVWAQDPMAVVQNRQAVMKEQGKDLTAIKAFLDGKGDLAQAQKAAADLTQDVRKIPTLFPPGTGMEQFPDKSWARPAIWTENDKFVAAQQNAAAKADALAAAAKSGDRAAIEAAFGDMGKNGCGGCHNTFREKKPS
jgi:cytochrome c556